MPLPPIPPISEDRIAWQIKRIAKRHPKFGPKALRGMAITILTAEDIADGDDDEVELNRRIEHERMLDQEFSQAEAQLTFEQEQFAAIEQEEKTAITKIQEERILQIQNDPLYKKIFIGKLPSTKPLTPPTGINKQDNFGRTALHRAVRANNFPEIRRLVLKENADTSIRDNGKNTPYMVAVRDGYKDIAKFLLNG